MARPSKPFFRKQTKSWYCSINGRQISLGKDREAAHKKFHALMADQSLLSAEITTIYELYLIQSVTKLYSNCPRF